MKTILIYSVDPGFLEEMRSKIQELETDRLSEILLFSEKEKLEFYAAGSREAADVVIIDMDQEDDGIAIAECVLEYQKNSQIIFVSGSDEYYLDVYNVDHVYFLKKPVESRLLAQALEKAGKKLQAKAGRGLFVALLLFVGIPLPGTGAWTGALAASILDMDFKSSVIAVMLGVLLAGIIMGCGSLLVLEGLF